MAVAEEQAQAVLWQGWCQGVRELMYGTIFRRCDLCLVER